ncbi:hypothetical protein [Caballeronia concitans]|jgi:hypothetical protein|uniref:Uncharacterized protein n=1 Tax=Caballeronia concitans TaxID=1777133 RepID=A0A658QUF9_9BURK|nr:hypothetical protein [Caballeronia concitans]KIG09440.1 hypothetical protein BurMR1_3116 [Burkholderia sp. MR1]SAL22880.1 hypothetical protein AWB72_01638 [Caballeronia concitans]
MIIYHHGAAFEPFVTRLGTAFIAKASILETDGHLTSLGDLGVFASEESAFKFAVYSATAFIEGDDLPVPPLQVCAL